MSEDLELWISSITDYVLRNIRICRKYTCAETVKEYQLIYACSCERKIDVKAILEDCTMVSVLAENIPCEEISEDDRNEYKEVMYAGEIVWSEDILEINETVTIKDESQLIRLYFEDNKEGFLSWYRREEENA